MNANKGPTISAIAAISAQTRALGKNNQLLWHLPEDLQYFRDTTRGHPVIMGRKTHESIGRPLPNRVNIVITRDPIYKSEGCVIMHSLDEALTYSNGLANEEVFVIGGGDIYTQALPKTDRLYLTLIDDPGAGADVFFPEYGKEFTKVIAEENGESGGKTFRRVTLER